MELLQTEFVHGDPPVLKVAGEIDLATVDALRTALEEAVSTDPTVVVDMAGVTFFDATGLRVILQAAASRNGAGPLTLLQRSARRVASRAGRPERAVDARDLRGSESRG